MATQYGPWATAINVGRNPQLSAFWRRRMSMLVPASQTSTVLSWRNLLCLVAAGALMIGLPTFRGAIAAADPQDAPPQTKAGDTAKAPKATPFAPAESGRQAKEQKTAARTMRVRVVGPDGKPVEGAHLLSLAAVNGQNSSSKHEYVSDVNGQAIIDLPQGVTAIQLALNKHGYLKVFRDVRLSDGHPLPHDLTIKLVTLSSEQAQAVAEFEKLNGTIGVTQSDNGQQVWAFLQPADDAQLEPLGRLPDLDELAILSPNVTDAGLVHLDNLHSLKTLTLGFEKITDEGLTHLEGLRGLKELQLTGPRITDAGLVHLQPLRALEKLELLNCAVTEAGMKHLKPLKELRTLISYGSKVDPATLKIIRALDSPTEIDCLDVPLGEVCAYLSDFHAIKVQIDEAALNGGKVGSRIPVTRKLNGASLAVTLHILLEPLGLDWMLQRGVVNITTRDIVAKRHPEVAKLQQALPNLKEVVVDW